MSKYSTLLAAAALAGGLSVAGAAQAAPIGPNSTGASADNFITQVAQGCGPGWRRGRWGQCRPMWGGPRVYGPRAWGPRFYGPGPRWRHRHFHGGYRHRW